MLAKELDPPLINGTLVSTVYSQQEGCGFDSGLGLLTGSLHGQFPVCGFNWRVKIVE